MGTLAADTAYDRAIRYADTIGAEHGRNAASWVTIPDPDAARRILAGIADGDPWVMDALPAPDLSGEWADTLTGPQLAADAVLAAGVDVAQDGGESDEWFTDVCDAYEFAFTVAVEEEVSRAASYQLAD